MKGMVVIDQKHLHRNFSKCSQKVPRASAVRLCAPPPPHSQELQLCVLRKTTWAPNSLSNENSHRGTPEVLTW